MASRALFAIALAIGCAPAERRWLEYPPIDGAEALIIASEIDGAIDHAEAWSLDPKPSSLRFGSAVLEGTRLHALVYAKSLAELGIERGALEPAPAPEGRPLPNADAIYQTKIEEQIGAWSLVGQGSLERFTARYRPPELPPCTELVARLETVTSTSEWQFSVNIDDRSVLLGSEAFELFVVTATAVVPLVDRPADLLPDAAIRDVDGGLLFGMRREIWKGRVIPPATLVAEPILFHNLGRLRFIAGRSDPPEIFAITRDRRFAVIDASGTSVLHQFDLEAGEFGVASSEPGDAVAVGESPDAMHYVGGETLPEPTPFSSESLTAVAHLDGFGYVAGTGRGQFAQRDGEWVPLGATGFSLTVLKMAPYPRGFLYGGANGGFGQYVEGRGFCEVAFPVGGQVEGVHPIGERVILMQKYLEAGIAILEP